jgi:hypothetical protein
MTAERAAGGRAAGKNETLHVGTDWVEVEILTDPFVILTRRGYAAAVEVEHLSKGGLYTVFVGAVSLAEKLEPIRVARGSLEGTQIRLKKESTDKFAQFVVEEVQGLQIGMGKGGDPNE